MTRTDEGAHWHDIVARASTIAERIAAGYRPDSHDSVEDACRRLQAWRQVVAGGDSGLFGWRLAQDGLDEEAVLPVLGPGHFPQPTPLPQWAQTLQEASRAAKAAFRLADVARAASPVSANPLPFEELCEPFVAVGRERLRRERGVRHSHLEESAHADLERELLGQLSLASARVFLAEFRVHRVARVPSWVRSLQGATGTSRHLYLDFVMHHLRDGLVAFFEEYSVLGRLMATLTDLWVESSVELLARLDVDWDDLHDAFAPRVPSGPVVAIHPGLSDRHHAGRTVSALNFASGLQLVYKPRDLSAEVAYYSLLAWLNDHGAHPALLVPRVVARPTHGWVEFVEHRSVRSLEDADEYYRRAGMLLALAYGLGGTDYHQENLIACGAFPVLVDAEMVVGPQMVDLRRPATRMRPAELAYRQLHETVLGTLFLPTGWSGGQAGLGDVSGSGDLSAQAQKQVSGWRDVNTDRMSYSMRISDPGAARHLPAVNGRLLSAARHVGPLVDGFRTMCGLLRSQRERLLADLGPVAAFARARVRFTFRPSADYAALLVALRNPKYLRDAADACTYADVLSRDLLPDGLWSAYWPILAEEQAALGRLDIPHFSVRATDDRLTLPSGRAIDQPFSRSAFRSCRDRLESLDEDEIERQVHLIRASLLLRGSSAAGALVSDTDRGTPTGPQSWLTPEAMLEEAAAIAERLETLAVRSSDGSASWLAFGFHPDSRRFRIGPIGYGLYDGLPGVALFLAAVDRLARSDRHRDLALAALWPLRQDIRGEALDRIVARLGLGGPLGCGIVVYALVRTSEFLGETSLHEDACRLAVLLSERQTVADEGLDILYGLGGAIIGFLTAYCSSGRAEFLDRAVGCGHRLLDARSPTVSGHRAWRTVQDRHLTGFSHGAAGIAYALLRLYEHAPDREFREGAREAIAYEQAVFDSAVGNWPDYREPDGAPVFSCSWCHGAPGIGLARLGSLSVLDSPETREEIDAALRAAHSTATQAIDGLCCGNMGLVELRLTAGRILSRPVLLDAAAQRTADIVFRAREQRGYSLMGEGIPSVAGCHPGFFQGETGIGYELLRVARPEQVPSVLLFA